jgi:manganese-dependent inorganic pyrophosphatase
MIKETIDVPKTYIIGHRNPDTDSVCAPYCYAYLKQRTDPSGQYIAGVLGSLNPQTQYIFSHLGIEIPPLVRDVYPKAEDLMLQNILTMRENDPVGIATKLVDEHKIRTIPVVDDANNYAGLVTVLSMAQYFMPRPYERRPRYIVRPENFGKVIPGHFLRKGVCDEVEARMMVGAMAYETFIERLKESMEGEEQDFPILIVGNRPELINYALEKDFPVIILTGMNDADCETLDMRGFEGWIFVSKVDTAETIRLLRTSIPVKAIAKRNHPVLTGSAPMAEVKKTLMLEDHHGIAVVQDGKLRGLITSSCLIDPVRHQVIMVDHNEPAQSVEGIDEADVIEILDHHRLAPLRTTRPIYVYAHPLGSSCTIVYKHFESHNVIPPRHIAALLLSGIITDTVILRSPTTTNEDIRAANALAALSELDIEQWGRDIFQHAASLTSADPDLAVSGDFKIYTEHGYRVGIAQVEVITLNDLDSVRIAYLEALQRTALKFALDWALLMVTDIIGEESILLSTAFTLADNMIYHRLDEHTFHLPGVLSRKKQLLPEVLRALE